MTIYLNYYIIKVKLFFIIIILIYLNKKINAGKLRLFIILCSYKLQEFIIFYFYIVPFASNVITLN